MLNNKTLTKTSIGMWKTAKDERKKTKKNIKHMFYKLSVTKQAYKFKKLKHNQICIFWAV